jgi:hypothetical protein
MTKPYAFTPPSDAPEVPAWLSSLEELAHELSNTNGMVASYLTLAALMKGEEAAARIQAATFLSVRSVEVLERLMREIYSLRSTFHLPPRQVQLRDESPGDQRNDEASRVAPFVKLLLRCDERR